MLLIAVVSGEGSTEEEDAVFPHVRYVTTVNSFYLSHYRLTAIKFVNLNIGAEYFWIWAFFLNCIIRMFFGLNFRKTCIIISSSLICEIHYLVLDTIIGKYPIAILKICVPLSDS